MRVDESFIKEALGMPSDAIIHNIVRHHHLNGTFLFYVEHDDLREVPLSEELPEITATITGSASAFPWGEFSFEWNQEG